MIAPPTLTAIPEAPVPPGGEVDWVIGYAGVRLRAALFTPPGRVRGSVVLSGGRTEPIEKYFETIQDLIDRGFVVLAHDWRGQGLSGRELPDRLKGHARGYRPFVEDFRRLLDAYEGRLPKPWVAVGHSMGGCLTLLALAQGERRFASACLSAPMLGLSLGRVSPLAARALCRVNMLLGRAKRYSLRRGPRVDDDAFEGNVLTHDERRFRRHRAQVAANPDLALGSPTWGWVDFALTATAYLARPERLHGVTIPVEIVTAGEDALVDAAAQAAAARNLPQGRQVTIPGAFHEILMETDDMRNIFLRVFDALTGKTAPKPAEGPKPTAPPAAKPVAATSDPVASPEAAKPEAAAPIAKPPEAPKPAEAKTPATRKTPAARPAAPAAAAPKSATTAKPAGAKAAARKPAAAAKSAPAKPAAPKPTAAKSAAPKSAAPKSTAKAAAAKAAVKAPAVKAAAAKPAAAKSVAAKAPATAKKPRAVKKTPA